MIGVRCAAILCFTAFLINTAEGAQTNTIFGKPAGGYSIDRIGYSCGYKAKMGCSAWVAYHLKPEYFGQERTLQGELSLYADPAVVASGLNAPPTDDIRNSSLVPVYFFTHANALGRGRECEKEVYSLVNVAPARGSETMPKVWRELDDATRQWAQEFKEVWVITGPIFKEDAERTMSRKMAIPDSFYKIVARKDGESLATIAFIIPQDASGKISEYLANIETIERSTDLDFFPTLPREKEKALKTANSVMWDLPGGKVATTLPGKGKRGPIGPPPDLIGKPSADSGKSERAPGDAAASEPASRPAPGGDGKVWVMGNIYYRSGSKRFGKGSGVYNTEEEAQLLGFTAGE